MLLGLFSAQETDEKEPTSDHEEIDASGRRVCVASMFCPALSLHTRVLLETEYRRTAFHIVVLSHLAAILS